MGEVLQEGTGFAVQNPGPVGIKKYRILFAKSFDPGISRDFFETKKQHFLMVDFTLWKYIL